MKNRTGIAFGRDWALFLIVGFIVGFGLLFFASTPVFADGSDDFSYSAATGDPAKWGKDVEKGRGELTQSDGRLNYKTAGTGTKLDSSDRPWKPTAFPVSSDWSVQIAVTNTATTASESEWASLGINIESARDPNDSVEVELAALGTAWAELHNNGQYVDGVGTTAGTSTLIRISFASATKVFTVAYYNGTSWVDFGSFGVAGSGGSINADWGLADSDNFVAFVFGYSQNMTVENGQIFGDDFQEIGGAGLEITSPSNGTHFDACSVFSPPLFQWNLPGTFQKVELRFYTPAKPTKPIKVRVKDTSVSELQLTSSTWKKVLALPGSSGGDVNFKIVGTNKGETAVESEVFTMTVDAPEAVEAPAISPTNQTELPTLTWGNACGTKFKVYFSPDTTFKRKKTLAFNDQNPTDNTGTFTTTLTNGTWTAIRKLVKNTAGSTIYWYVESWDAIKRHQKTDTMQFTLEP